MTVVVKDTHIYSQEGIVLDMGGACMDLKGKAASATKKVRNGSDCHQCYFDLEVIASFP